MSEGQAGSKRRGFGRDTSFREEQGGQTPTLHLPGVRGPPMMALPVCRIGLWLGDGGGGLDGELCPAVAHLPGADEDALAGRERAVAVNVKLGDVAIARFGGRQTAKDDEV